MTEKLWRIVFPDVPLIEAATADAALDKFNAAGLPIIAKEFKVYQRKCEKCGKAMTLDKRFNLTWVCSCGNRRPKTNGEYFRLAYEKELLAIKEALRGREAKGK